MTKNSLLLRETQKRRSLLVLKTIKKTSLNVYRKQNVMGEECIRGYNGNLSLNEVSKKLARKVT